MIAPPRRRPNDVEFRLRWRNGSFSSASTEMTALLAFALGVTASRAKDLRDIASKSVEWQIIC
jgi:hypothetical protein